MRTSVTIFVPLPSTKGIQEESGHWRNRSENRKKLKRLGHTLTLVEIGDQAPPKWKRASLSIEIIYPTRHRRDTLNTVSALKSQIDGVVQAGLIADDCWTCLEIEKPAVRLRRPGEPAGVNLTFTCIEP